MLGDEGQNWKKECDDEQKKRKPTDNELQDKDLDDIAGGISQTSIRLCSRCKIRIAVQGMEICGLCYRETQL